MKKSIFILGVALCILFVSCKKNSSKTGEIYGEWKLTETLADPGDGSGKYVKVREDQYLTFDKSGSISSNAMPSFKSFKLIDSGRIEFESKDSMEKIVYRYQVSSQSLTLNPPCFEPCGLKFIRK